MKKLVVLIAVLLTFCVCAGIGFVLAPRADLFSLPQPVAATQESEPGDQYNLLIMQVDQMGAPAPKLVSIWYISLFFLEEKAPTLTFAQLYAPYSASASAQQLEEAFALAGSGEPAPAFVRAISALRIRWDAYFVVDSTATQRMLEWLNGPGDHAAAFGSRAQVEGLLVQTCQSLANLSVRELPAFDWTGLAPDHFHSNLRMELGLAYWNRMNASPLPVRCEMILAQ